MNRDVSTLLFAQFLTAFADNALLFTAVAIALQQATPHPWYLPAIQAAFLVAFVVLAPWVGPYADSRSKARVLTSANLVKAAGAGMMLGGGEPLIAYAIVGVGAALYAPAKYGILPELLPSEALVRANGWIEGSTILAILLGSVAGGRLADSNIPLALSAVLGLYLASAVATLFIRRTPPSLSHWPPVMRHFVSMNRTLLRDGKARIAALGVSLFWASAAVLRVVLVAWAPVVLAMHRSEDVAVLMVYVAVGVALGSVLAPRLIPLPHLRRARLAAYMMGACVILLSTATSLGLTRTLLILTGLFGGMFMVPMNAVMQAIGHRSIGSGGAVAVQHFYENLAMVLGTGVYSLAAARGLDPVASLLVLGVVVVVVTLLISLRLPPLSNPAASPLSSSTQAKAVQPVDTGPSG